MEEQVEDAESRPSQPKVVIQEKEVIKMVPNDKKEKELRERLRKSEERENALKNRCNDLKEEQGLIDKKNADLGKDLTRIRGEREGLQKFAKSQVSKSNEESRHQKETLRKLNEAKTEIERVTDEKNNAVEEGRVAVADATRLTNTITSLRAKLDREVVMAAQAKTELTDKYNGSVDYLQKTTSQYNRTVGNQRTQMDKQKALIEKQLGEIKNLKGLNETKQAEIIKINALLKTNINDQVPKEMIQKVQERDTKIQQLENQIIGDKTEYDTQLKSYKLIPKELKSARDRVKTVQGSLKTTQDNLTATQGTLKTTQESLKTTQEDLKTAQDDLRKSRCSNARMVEQLSKARNTQNETTNGESMDSGNVSQKTDALDSNRQFELESRIETLNQELTQSNNMLVSTQKLVDLEIEKGLENVKEGERRHRENMESAVTEAVKVAVKEANTEALSQHQMLKTKMTQKLTEMANTPHNAALVKKLETENKALKKRVDDEEVAKLTGALEFQSLEKKASDIKMDKLSKANLGLSKKCLSLTNQMAGMVQLQPPLGLFAKVGALAIKSTTPKYLKPTLRARGDAMHDKLCKPVKMIVPAKRKVVTVEKKRGGKQKMCPNPLLTPKVTRLIDAVEMIAESLEKTKGPIDPEDISSIESVSASSDAGTGGGENLSLGSDFQLTLNGSSEMGTEALVKEAYNQLKEAQEPVVVAEVQAPVLTKEKLGSNGGSSKGNRRGLPIVKQVKMVKKK